MAFEAYPTGGQQLKGLTQSLYRFGFMDVILPALLIFAVFFAVLQMVKLFSTQKKKPDGTPDVYPQGHPDAGKPIIIGDKKINGLLAIVIALSVVLPHALGRYPANLDPVIIIGKLLPGAAMMFAAILSIVLLLGLVVKDATTISPFQALVAIVAAGVLVLMFVMSIFPGFIPTFGFLRDPSIQAAIVVVCTIAVVVWFIMRTEPKEKTHVAVKRWMTEKVP